MNRGGERGAGGGGRPRALLRERPGRPRGPRPPAQGKEDAHGGAREDPGPRWRVRRGEA